MLLLGISNPIVFLGLIISILLSLTVHEYAHAWTAFKLGDPTAKLSGRISLNPFVHLDIFGTIMLLLAGFGWGKPVPINPVNLKSKWYELVIALAGPLSNLILAILVALIIRFIPLPISATEILYILIQINLVFMIFNLFPIPPLDGSAIFKVILSDEAYQILSNLSAYLFIAFIFFLYSTPFVSTFILNTVNTITNFLITKI